VTDSDGKTNAFTSGWAKLKSSLFEMDSLDSVEVLIAVEETFGVTITDAEAEAMATPRDVIDWLLPRVSDKQPNEKAMRILNGQSVLPWDRAQVSAVVRAIIVEQTGTRAFDEDSSFRNDIFS
jgi:Phosphopantetheine attachment site